MPVTDSGTKRLLLLQKTTPGKVKIAQLQRLEAPDEILMSSYGLIDPTGLVGLEFDAVEYLPTNIDATNPKGGIEVVNQIAPYSV